MTETAFLQVNDLTKNFTVGGRGLLAKKSLVRAVDQVSFHLDKGETLGLVGESGSGKTTIGRCVLRMITPDSGRVRLGEFEVTDTPAKLMKHLRRRMQIIFQDPYGALTPRLRVGALLREPLDVHNLGNPENRLDKVQQILGKVGLRPEHVDRYPHEFSGGQRQRIAIARALISEPSLIVADEPVSALDVSIQAQIINLLVRLQKEMGLSYLFISHDLSVIKYVADRIAVLYLGRIVEMSGREELYRRPLHPYTQALLSAIPKIQTGTGKDHQPISGEVPSPLNPPPGCHFNPRCPNRLPVCSKSAPALAEVGQGHRVACHLHRG